MALSQTLSALLFVPFLLSATIFALPSDDIKQWCSQTPNPEPCEYILSSQVSKKPIKQKTDFFKVLTQLTLDRAVKAHNDAYSLGPKCKNQLEKAAWDDCLELYEYTISRLNETISTKCTQTDAQTWLSSALTNLETCSSGFYDFGVTDNVLPLMSNNVSKLISNTLSMNKVQYNEPSYKDGFPTWVKPGDRKLLQTSSPASSANVVVAADGSGNFKTINEAISSVKSTSSRFVIYVKAGTYNEQVAIKLNNIMLVGDGIGKTIITGSKSVGGGSTTFNSATVSAVGDGFIARDITFRNTAGPTNHQAVAFRSGSDLSVFYKCGFEGNQDTLYVHSERQFYRECDISGTVDFIFGNAAVVIQNCNIIARNPPQRTITVTAQGRTDPNQNTGISIHNSKISPASDLSPSSVKSYLGRPWKQYSRTVILKTSIDGFINPAGWLEWDGNFALSTLFYGEYLNTGCWFIYCK
ncbi:Pectinesterase [Quillaja saponaria]|uniref:Pectinesterase n=1 Tax=Quillaja saponaria TaxID=32244 RepID=A0AAD7LQB8_QUISA|nr:Pectinesterase [Quillaja saponaria]